MPVHVLNHFNCMCKYKMLINFEDCNEMGKNEY
jgi:hypothetical protein